MPMPAPTLMPNWGAPDPTQTWAIGNPCTSSVKIPAHHLVIVIGVAVWGGGEFTGATGTVPSAPYEMHEIYSPDELIYTATTTSTYNGFSYIMHPFIYWIASQNTAWEGDIDLRDTGINPAYILSYKMRVLTVPDVSIYYPGGPFYISSSEAQGYGGAPVQSYSVSWTGNNPEEGSLIIGIWGLEDEDAVPGTTTDIDQITGVPFYLWAAGGGGGRMLLQYAIQDAGSPISPGFIQTYGPPDAQAYTGKAIWISPSAAATSGLPRGGWGAGGKWLEVK